MFKFLKRAGLFGLCMLCTLAVFWLYNRINEREVLLSANTVITGDSHIMTAIQPDSFADAVNIAQSSESYLFSYLKLQKIFEDNPDIDTVILGFSYHNLSSYYENKLNSDEAYTLFSRMIPILSKGDISFLNFDEKAYWRAYMQTQLLKWEPKEPSYIGEYMPVRESFVNANIEKTIGKHFYINGEISKDEDSILSISYTYNLAYLDTIVVFCEDRGIELILCTPPLHSEYIEQVPEDYIKCYKQLSLELKEDSVEVLDYGEWKLADTMFKDFNHLNSYGANTFSAELRNRIN